MSQTDMGGWASGAAIASNPIIASATRTLRYFGGDDLTRAQAAVLLTLWVHRSTLTRNEIDAILSRFPDDLDEPPMGVSRSVNVSGL